MKLRSLFPLPILVGCATVLGACAESVERAVFEPDSSYQVEVLDVGDCHPNGSCPKKHSVISDIYAVPFTGNVAQRIEKEKSKGFWGRIDKECREVVSDKYAADIDFIGIHAEAGTPLKISVKGATYGLLQPIMTIFDSNGNELAMVASDRLSDSREASTKIIAPSSDVFYVAIEEMKNYELGLLDSCSNGKTIGGKDYGYILKVDKEDLAITDLNFVQSEVEQKNRFVELGEIHYYHFAMDKSVKSADVSFISRGGGAGADPRLAAIEHTSEKRYVWGNYGSSLPQARIDINARNAYSDGATLHFVFAVIDQNSRAGYEYSFKVTAVK